MKRTGIVFGVIMLFLLLSAGTASAEKSGLYTYSIKGNGTILAAHIPNIETVGGGSVRCMLAEVVRTDGSQ